MGKKAAERNAKLRKRNELKTKEHAVKKKASERRIKEHVAKAKAKEHVAKEAKAKSSLKIIVEKHTYYELHRPKGPGAHEKKRKIHTKLKKAKHLMKEKGYKLKVVVKITRV